MASHGSKSSLISVLSPLITVNFFDLEQKKFKRNLMSSYFAIRAPSYLSVRTRMFYIACWNTLVAGYWQPNWLNWRLPIDLRSPSEVIKAVTHRKTLKTSNSAWTMLVLQERISQKHDCLCALLAVLSSQGIVVKCTATIFSSYGGFSHSKPQRLMLCIKITLKIRN